ncbi:seven-hairpin glycosidase [Violaceomyces palustris]|uniref:Seven-hairpin glycosidase n=1 Tax=Violaceomyces palustris TaxID=1673888 RepID=A0ACD0NXI2_9BASI|nr:seven-hairpin glycosidase [Violaceomyces palustris]
MLLPLSRNFAVLLLGLLALSSHRQGTGAVQIQSPNLSQSPTSKQRADAVKKAYVDSYNDYKKYALGYDALAPVSKKGVNYLGGWGATVVDSLTTSYVMGLQDLFQEAVDFTKRIDFTKTEQSTISLFETNIRYLGGMLSAFELGGKKETKLVDQAKIVGDHLLKGWVGVNDLPFNTLHWNNDGQPDTNSKPGIAEAGTLLIEFDRLSKYTGDPKYLQYAEKAMKAIINSKPVFPGLYAQNYDASTNQASNDYVTWGGGSDSFFEYLVKYAYLVGSDSSQPYLPTWVDSVKSSIRNLITSPQGTDRKDLKYLTDYSASNGGNLPRFSHLGCFVGGNWLLGSKMLGGYQPFQTYGLDLVESCYNTYNSSTTGIGPETFVFIGEKGGTNGVNVKDYNFYGKNGFDYEVEQYILRPEVLESVFYAYRITGDQRWQDLSWKAFQSILKYCKAPAALSSIDSVKSSKPNLLDDSESFLYAETFKYIYLTFADPSVVNLDRYVLNTEGHPFLIDQPGKAKYQVDLGDTEPVPSPPPPTPTSQNGEEEKPGSVPVPKFSSLPDLGKLVQKPDGSYLLGGLLDLLDRASIEWMGNLERGS